MQKLVKLLYIFIIAATTDVKLWFSEKLVEILLPFHSPYVGNGFVAQYNIDYYK